MPSRDQELGEIQLIHQIQPEIRLMAACHPLTEGRGWQAARKDDVNANNFSLLYTKKMPTLMLLYDLLRKPLYPAPTAKMALKLGSKYRFGEAQECHWGTICQGSWVLISPDQKVGDAHSGATSLGRRQDAGRRSVLGCDTDQRLHQSDQSAP